MKVRQSLAVLAAALLLSLTVGFAFAQDAGTIVDVATGNEDFSTLVSLVQTAGLTDVLANPEASLTVFAPTNAAFAALPQYVLDYLSASPELLTRVLTYHVIEGAITSDTITASMMVPSMEMTAPGADLVGSELSVSVTGENGIFVDNARVITPDIQASNGVIHVIDAVLIPAIELSVVDPLAVTENVVAAGSSTVYPVTERMADLFENEGYAGTITVDSIGTGAGGERFCVNAETDLWNASRAAKPEEAEACAGNGRTLAEFFVAVDALALAVSSENTFLTGLTFEQLAQIFSGAAVTWDQVDPSYPAEQIRLFSPGSDSGTYDYFVEEIFDQDEAPIQGAPGIQFSEDDNVLVQGIEGSPYAIGYFGFAYYQENQDKLRAVPIEGVVPSEATGTTGEYPLSRPLFIYSAPEIMQAKPQVADFINFYLQNVSAQLGTASDQIGYIRVNEFIQRRNALYFLAASNAGM